MTHEQSAGIPDANLEPSRRIRLDIAYDGTDFFGWGRQPHHRTVQGEIESALATVFRRYPPAPTLIVAGRTDAGVHATGQVAHLDLTAAQVASLLRRRGHTPPADDVGEVLAHRINGILGPITAVVITRGSTAATGFDARFSALWRRYEYRIADQSAFRDPLRRNSTVWYPVPLDIDAMDAAAGGLLGLRDFAGYCKPRDGATTIRTLLNFRWQRDTDGVLVAQVTADAFCRNMVRALVGACVAVGAGKLPAADLATMRRGPERPDAFKTMPSRGLTLVEVGYPDEAELAARAQLTRAHRTLA